MAISARFQETLDQVDFAKAEFDEFKGGIDEFNRVVEEDLFTVDQKARFEELLDNISEAENAFSVAEIEMQQENAAEVQKAKEAEREATLIRRSDRKEEMKF